MLSACERARADDYLRALVSLLDSVLIEQIVNDGQLIASAQLYTRLKI